MNKEYPGLMSYEIEAPPAIDPDDDGISAAVVVEPDAAPADAEGVTTPEEALENAEETNPALEPAAGEASEEDKPRRPRGWLEESIKTLLEGIKDGSIDPAEVLGKDPGSDAKLTPHFIAKMVTKRDNLDAEPSTGAVAAVFNRWQKIGAVEMSDNPQAFVDFSDAAKSQGIDKLKVQAKQDAKAAKAAEASESA